MLITKEVNVRINNKNIDHYSNLGYDIDYGENINVLVDHLSKYSDKKIRIKCDVCGDEFDRFYWIYVKRKFDTDTCQKCKYINVKKTNLERYGYDNGFKNRDKIKQTKLDKYGDENYNNKSKNKKTCLEKYGVEHPLQTIEIINKIKQTNLEKYGVECTLHDENISNKVKQTMLDKYGVEYAGQSDEIKNKIKQTVQNKYGVDYVTQSNDFKNKSKQTKLEKYGDENFVNHEKTKNTKLERYGNKEYRNDEKRNLTILDKYGVEHVSQNEDIKKKKIETSLKNYGVEHPLQSKIVMDKVKKTNMEKYGAPHPMMNDEVKEKSYLTFTENKKWTPRELQSDFYKYSYQVYKQTLLNKKKLFENWNGKDYYTDIYIKENLNLNSNDKEYPTIDHKMSMKYGFDNQIEAKIIGSIDNLCITTRSNNSFKNSKNNFLYIDI